MNKNAFISLAATLVIIMGSAGAATAGAPAAVTAAASPSNAPVQLAYAICYDDGWCCEAVNDDGGYDDQEETCWEAT
jgi:hypothetical protein